MMEADQEAKTPVNTVRLSKSMKQLVVDKCVICGDTHRHGAKDPTVAKGERSHRASHCHGTDHTGGYFIELADDADPPERWYSWLGVSS